MTSTRSAVAGCVVALGLGFGPCRGAAQVLFEGRAEIGRAEHRVRDAGVLEVTSGTVLGAGLGLVADRRWELWGSVRGGRLAAVGAGEDRDFAEVEVVGGAQLHPWLTMEAGVTVRTYSSTLARQRWSALCVGAHANIPLALEGLRGIVRGQWMPATSVNGLPRPNVALAAAAGLEWQGPRVGLGALYALERYDFPAGAVPRRLEEFASLRLRATVLLRRVTRSS